MARHPKGSTPILNNELIKKLAAAIRGGAYVETAAALCGISKQSLYRWLKQAESDDSTELLAKLSYAVRRAMAQAEARDLKVIDDAAQKGGQWQAAAWRLERRHPDRWARKSQMQISGPEGGPVEIEVQSPEERQRRIEELIKKRGLIGKG